MNADDFCSALVNDGPMIDSFLQTLSGIHDEHAALERALEFAKSASTIFFVAAAMLCVLTSKTVVSIPVGLGAVGTKLKETARVMITGAHNATQHVSSIYTMACGLLVEIQRLSEMVADQVHAQCVENAFH